MYSSRLFSFETARNPLTFQELIIILALLNLPSPKASSFGEDFPRDSGTKDSSVFGSF